MSNPALTCDPDAVPPGTLPKHGTVPILLTNRREVPRLRSRPPLLTKVDQAQGGPGPGVALHAVGQRPHLELRPLGTGPTIDPGAWPTYLQDEMP